ncbi:hypothetical protein NC652_020905 [Populus alba x Populus x berolinensis]|nr:hypothetical protein NC652_020905 [Populus alba x Populus x berolinensis]
MLQYQMGSRLLTFLQKPQIKFARKRIDARGSGGNGCEGPQEIIRKAPED